MTRFARKKYARLLSDATYVRTQLETLVSPNAIDDDLMAQAMRRLIARSLAVSPSPATAR